MQGETSIPSGFGKPPPDDVESVLQPVSVFTVPGLAGTRASVWLFSAPPDSLKEARLAAADGNEACCFAWPEGDDLRVICYNHGVAIDYCGHGLLACAAAWRSRQGLPRRLRTLKGDYGISADDEDRLWLHAPRLTCSSAPLAPADWFNYPPEAAATAGDDHGYWILRWADGFDLKRLKPNFPAICRSTDRALIATRRARPGSDHDVGLRYFAPQYGKNEDSVTGSAAVVLADYWQQPELVLRQFSARGGLLQARLDKDRVAISGTVSLDRAATGEPRTREP